MILLLYSPILFLVILIIIATVFTTFFRKRPTSFVDNVKKEVKDLTDNIERLNGPKKDSIRKINHILFFFGLVLLWIVCMMIVINITGSSEGMIPKENNMILIYIQLVFNTQNRSNIIFDLGWFYYILFFFFYAFLILMIINEFTRKSKRFLFPFNFISRFVLTKEEAEGYGSYLYFAIGHLFASFFCPPMIFFAILGMSSIGDLMASQIGMRYGKRVIPWNNHKTWEGTIAATFTCFIICSFFVGFIWGTIFSISFLIFDTITGKGFKDKDISDNILIPIGCAIIYLIIRFVLNLNYLTFFLGNI